MTTLLNKIRYLLQDTAQTVNDVHTYPTSSIFTLSEPNPIAIVDVYKNDVSSGVLYSYNSTTKKVTITSAVTSNDVINIEFTAYLNYSNAALTNHIQAALLYLSIHNYFDFEYDATDDTIYPTLEPREENLIALITATLINKPVRSYHLPDVSISFAEEKTADEKISQIIAHFKKDSAGIFTII